MLSWWWTMIYKYLWTRKLLLIINKRRSKQLFFYSFMVKNRRENKQPILNPPIHSLSSILVANRTQRLLLFWKNTPLCIFLLFTSLSLYFSFLFEGDTSVYIHVMVDGIFSVVKIEDSTGVRERKKRYHHFFFNMHDIFYRRNILPVLTGEKKERRRKRLSSYAHQPPYFMMSMQMYVSIYDWKNAKKKVVHA